MHGSHTGQGFSFAICECQTWPQNLKSMRKALYVSRAKMSTLPTLQLLRPCSTGAPINTRRWRLSHMHNAGRRSCGSRRFAVRCRVKGVCTKRVGWEMVGYTHSHHSNADVQSVWSGTSGWKRRKEMMTEQARYSSFWLSSLSRRKLMKMFCVITHSLALSCWCCLLMESFTLPVDAITLLKSCVDLPFHQS